jgi:hypothetical protein
MRNNRGRRGHSAQLNGWVSVTITWIVAREHVCDVAFSAFGQSYILQLGLLALPRSLGNELSTPFLNLMHFMKDANIPKDTPIVKANQIAFAVVFFFARVVVDLYVIYALIASGAIQTQVSSFMCLVCQSKVFAFRRNSAAS